MEAGVRGPSQAVVQAYLGLKLGVWSYNGTVKHWEPVVEPWDVIAQCAANYGTRVRGAAGEGALGGLQRRERRERGYARPVLEVSRQGRRTVQGRRCDGPHVACLSSRDNVCRQRAALRLQMSSGIEPGVAVSIKSSNDCVYTTLAFSAVHSMLMAFAGGWGRVASLQRFLNMPLGTGAG